MLCAQLGLENSCVYGFRSPLKKGLPAFLKVLLDFQKYQCIFRFAAKLLLKILFTFISLKHCIKLLWLLFILPIYLLQVIAQHYIPRHDIKIF